MPVVAAVVEGVGNGSWAARSGMSCAGRMWPPELSGGYSRALGKPGLLWRRTSSCLDCFVGEPHATGLPWVDVGCHMFGSVVGSCSKWQRPGYSVRGRSRKRVLEDLGLDAS